MWRDSTNWQRWGQSDRLGAANLLTPERVRDAAQLVKTGERISLARRLTMTEPGCGRDVRTQDFGQLGQRGGGAVTEAFTILCHGEEVTHLDALCHVWEDSGGWNGATIDSAGVETFGVDNWSLGFVARGVFLDVPRYRGTVYVDRDDPVTARELALVAAAQAIDIRPGDALVVYCGRDSWESAGHRYLHEAGRPGLHVDCIEFLADADCAMLVWDMRDALPSADGTPWGVHACICRLGIGVVDNAYLPTLAKAVASSGRSEFMLTVAPLVISGATGSPVNPIAVL